MPVKNPSLSHGLWKEHKKILDLRAQVLNSYNNKRHMGTDQVVLPSVLPYLIKDALPAAQKKAAKRLKGTSKHLDRSSKLSTGMD